MWLNPYSACAEDLDEMNIEIMRNTLYKAYLDDFAKFCNKMGGSTAAVMGDLLSFEVCSLPHSTSTCPSACLSVVSGGRNTYAHLAPLAAYVMLSCVLSLWLHT